MALEYITDKDAVKGVIKTGDIDINGKKRKISDHTNIGLLINAPRSHVFIDKLTIEQVYKGVEIRAARSVTIKSTVVDEFYNDAVQILASNVRMLKLFSSSTISKVYSDRSHSDHLQIFNHTLRRVENITIDDIFFYSRNHIQQANVHFTESHWYRRMFMGRTSFVIDTDHRDGYPYALSATNLSDSIIGGANNDTGNLNYRVKNVKGGYWKSINNHFVDIDDKRIEKDPKFKFKAHHVYPIRPVRKIYVDKDITAEFIKKQAILANKEKW